MAKMNGSLPVDRGDLVEHAGSEGGAFSNEVARDARHLLHHNKAVDREKLAILRREIDLGLEAAAAGRFSRKTVSEIADDVRCEHSGGWE